MRSSPRKRDAPDRHTGGAAQIESPSTPLIGTHSNSAQHHDQRELVVVGDHMPPDQRRTLPGAWVNSCPGCGMAHRFQDIGEGETKDRVAACGARLRVHVRTPEIYGVDHADTDLWLDEDGVIYRGNQRWMQRSA